VNVRFKPFDAKYSTFSFSEFVFRWPHPASAGGAYRDRHDTWGGEAVAALSRATNGFDADGEVVWSWPPGAEARAMRSRIVANAKTHFASRGKRGQSSRSPRRARISR